MQRMRQLVLILATLLSITGFAVAPVAADSGSGETDRTTTTTNTETETETDSPKISESQIQSRLEQIREQAKQKLETEREKTKEKTQEERQKACEAHQADVDRKIANSSAAGQRHLDTFSGLLTKVENFYTNNKLNVANYSTLLATAKDKQAAAQTAVDALKALNVTLDCAQKDPAQSVSTLKTAIANARAALQAYRLAIKDIIVALEGASSAQQQTTTTTTTTGGNQ